MNIFLLDPYNDEQLDSIKRFEDENKCIDKLSSYIKRIRDTITYEDYYDTNKNEFEGILFTEKTGKISDCCYINVERDRKVCTITPININNKNKKRNIPEQATNYALDTLGMEEVFISANIDDNDMITNLELSGFENIGEVEGKILLLKDKEEKENSQRMI